MIDDSEEIRLLYDVEAGPITHPCLPAGQWASIRARAFVGSVANLGMKLYLRFASDGPRNPSAGWSESSTNPTSTGGHALISRTGAVLRLGTEPTDPQKLHSIVRSGHLPLKRTSKFTKRRGVTANLTLTIARRALSSIRVHTPSGAKFWTCATEGITNLASGYSPNISCFKPDSLPLNHHP
jgi:hypothetical protein